ncbi:protein kinase domain-containing protein [Ramlibacter montanisoli]|uniref:Protein kinase n=1 Tax=Ramlibacter montanisoli TaxID=2732512 RepID=A0A849KJ06_9BURK|nr:protein kinase [Ramlibacter montanisoli]NNU44033.1 protein kinase [Ramlibacter montanisoli]
MTSVLVVEDDDAIRGNVARLLGLEGYEVSVAVNGSEGLERARALRPDLVVSDVNMPGLDGFALVEALRADPALATTAVLMLTALDDRASMRRGMTAGADDYLAKPFTRTELLEALEGLLKKRGRIAHSIDSAVQAREDQLRRAFTERLGGDTVAAAFAFEPPQGAVADQVLDATVLFSDIRNFTSIAEKLGSSEVAELLTRYFERTSEPVLRHGGRHLKFIGDGLMAVFADQGSGSPLPAARRAVSAALALALATHQFRGWLQQRFADRGLPPFAIGVGLHCGEVTICRLGSTQVKETTPIGDTVNTAARLQGASKELGWTVVASSAVLEQAGEGVQTGGMTSLEVRGRNGWVDVAEIVGLEASALDRQNGMGELAERAEEIRLAVQVNSEITARAVKGALRNKLSTLKHHQFEPGEAPLRLKGFRLLRKLASGSTTEVFLAEREADGLPLVLKVLSAAGTSAGANLTRFIQEYALLSRIAHPHVIRIYDQGFSDDHAYIAMEYFERGDLRTELRGGMFPERAIDVVRQVAEALQAVHAKGIIHRDLKPENVMLRPDGTVVLADFGVAKPLQSDAALGLAQTLHGEVVGTPYYLSPEQAKGGTITPASDLYSLGVMFFEMLAGARPFAGETLELLLAQHLTAPAPRLPEDLTALQPIVDRLMAKQPQDRHASAGALLEELGRPELLRTFSG